VASGIALVNKAKEHIKDGRPTILSSLINEDLKILEPDLIIEAANQGDQFSINLLSEIGSNLGKGLAILIQIFNPELIILGGQIAEAAQFITTPVQQSINTYAKIQLKDRTEVILSELGKKSSLLGVSQAVMDQIFTDRISALKSNLN
jgi:predicted NBD/HSP70 family sugar kinase